MSEHKPVLLSGIKPTGDLHIGNYFGAMIKLFSRVSSLEKRIDRIERNV